MGEEHQSYVGRKGGWGRLGRGLLCLDWLEVLVSRYSRLAWWKKEEERERGGDGQRGREGEGHFHSIQLLFLRYDLVDVWCEEGVCCHELVADRALDGGLDFGFRAGGDASFVSTKVPQWRRGGILLFEHLGGFEGGCGIESVVWKGLEILGSR